MTSSPGAQLAKLVDPENITGIPSFDLLKPVVRIGRSMTNDYLIKEKTVSGKHASIERREAGYFLIDLNSSNGTRINGKRIKPDTPYLLEDDDEIHFDRYRFLFSLDEEAPAVTVSDGSGTIDIGTKSGWTMETASGLPTAQPSAGDDEASMHSGTIDIGSRPPGSGTDRTDPSTMGPESKIGNYEVIQLLGRGGFGSVWKCKDSSGNPVAVKLLNPDALENERAVRKFFHEAIILSRLDHPNICRFIDFFPHEENYAIVMDFVQGTDLKEMLKEQKAPLELQMACRIAAQVLDAFDYAHHQQVMHRDIKPENIILDLNNQARIMDFGIAKLSSSETQHTSAYMISPAYTAPERFDVNNKVDYPSDIYSLGLAFYEVFTGTHPFKVSSPAEMIFAHLNTLPPPPADIVQVPKRISDAILKSLEKDPKDRFKSFAEFKIAMFGETAKVPEVEAPQAGMIACSGEFYGVGAALLGMYAAALKKYQHQAKSFRVIQEGTRLELIIEPHEGRPMRISKDLTKILAESKREE